MWQSQEKEEFISSIRVFFGLAAIVYILHYHTVDMAVGLAPSDLWFNYRYGMAAIALFCLGFYFMPKLHNMRFYKLPAVIASAVFCYFQTKTIIWYPQVPYLYSFGFILISVIVLRESIFVSVLYAATVLFLIWPIFMEAGQSPSMIFSASAVTLIFVVYMRAKYGSEVRLFIANQRNLDNQKKIIEINLEFSNQIKSFLPGEIARRLTHYVQEQRMSVLQATDEVLRPRKLEVACLFSDIRGFTKGVGDLNGFVSQSMLPNLKACTVAVERFQGISRKIGDLIFAYYDSPSFENNLKNVLKTAVEISSLNSEMNQELPEEMKVKRFILISGGEAIVGNLSGYDSNIEITAIGKPVNCLSRIDEITKHKQLREHLTEGDILLTPSILDAVKSTCPGIELSMISIAAMGIKIRDFEEIEELYLFPITKRNYNLLFSSSAKVANQYKGAS